MFCPSCGASVPDNARFCGACGARLEPTAPTAAPPTPAVVAPVPPSPASASAVVPAVAPKSLPNPCRAPVPVSPLYDWLLATVPWMTFCLLAFLSLMLPDTTAKIADACGVGGPLEGASVRANMYRLSFLPLSFLFNWLGCKALRAAGRTTKDGRPVGVQFGDVLGFILLGPLCTPFCVRRLNRLGGHGPGSMLTSIFLPILTCVLGIGLLYIITGGK